MKIKCLSSNSIKIIAVVCMVLDHIGFMLYPQIYWLRAVGRLAFPLFAYFIAEGCKYTRNKLRYFTLIFAFGVIFQLVYDLVVGDSGPYNIFLTFALSIAIVYCLYFFKRAILLKKRILEYSIIFVLVTTLIVFLSLKLNFDYGIFGVLLPVFVSLPNFYKLPAPNKIKAVDNEYIKLLLFTIGVCLMPLSNELGNLLFWGLLSVPILLLYNGKRGKLNLKYMFYIVYPLHIVIIYYISIYF